MEITSKENILTDISNLFAAVNREIFKEIQQERLPVKAND